MYDYLDDKAVQAAAMELQLNRANEFTALLAFELNGNEEKIQEFRSIILNPNTPPEEKLRKIVQLTIADVEDLLANFTDHYHRSISYNHLIGQWALSMNIISEEEWEARNLKIRLRVKQIADESKYETTLSEHNQDLIDFVFDLLNSPDAYKIGGSVGKLSWVRDYEKIGRLITERFPKIKNLSARKVNTFIVRRLNESGFVPTPQFPEINSRTNTVDYAIETKLDEYLKTHRPFEIIGILETTDMVNFPTARVRVSKIFDLISAENDGLKSRKMSDSTFRRLILVIVDYLVNLGLYRQESFLQAKKDQRLALADLANEKKREKRRFTNPVIEQ